MHTTRRRYHQVFTLVWCVCALLTSHAQTYNLITNGDMENAAWTGVPGNTDLTTSFDFATGMRTTTSLKTIVTNLGGAPYYVLRGEDNFPMAEGEKMTMPPNPEYVAGAQLKK